MSASGRPIRVLAGLIVGGTVLAMSGRALAASDGPTVRIGVNEKKAAVRLNVTGQAVAGPAGGGQTPLPVTERGATVRLAGYAVAGPLSPSSWMARSLAVEMRSSGLPAVTWAEAGGYRAAAGPLAGSAEATTAATSSREAGLPAGVAGVADGRPEAAGLEIITAEGRSTGVVAGPISVTRTGAADLRVNGRRYRGEFLAVRDPQGLISGVNRLPLEQYLRGVVPEEMPSAWPLEALKAQAVAARTYTLANLGAFEKYGYDLSATVRSQAYGGQDSERPSTDTAVAGTRGLVATYGGKLISTYYHAHAGGRTDSSLDVWGFDEPYLRGTAETYEKPNPWWVVYNRRGLERTVDGFLPASVNRAGASIGTLLRVVPGRFTPAGRALDVTLVGTGGTFTVPSERLRGAVGATRMKSILYSVQGWPEVTFITAGAAGRAFRFVARVGGRPSVVKVVRPRFGPTVPLVGRAPELFVLTGQGYGHGVGMSQWGAYEMAARGFTFDRILNHFYQGTSVSPMSGR